MDGEWGRSILQLTGSGDSKTLKVAGNHTAGDSIPLSFTLDAGAGVFEVDTTPRASSAAVAAKRERSGSRKALNAAFPVWFVGTAAARMTRANASCWLVDNPPEGHPSRKAPAWGTYLDRCTGLVSTGKGYVLA